MDNKIALLKDAATRLRINSIKATEAAKSGHPTSCSSIAEVMAVLFLDEMKYFVYQPRHPSNDRFVLSKGHAAPILYAAWAEAGLLSEKELLNLRKIDSDLEGHPTPVSFHFEVTFLYFICNSNICFLPIFHSASTLLMWLRVPLVRV